VLPSSPFLTGLREANVNSARAVIENLAGQAFSSARSGKKGIVFVHGLRLESVVRECLLAFFFLWPERR